MTAYQHLPPPTPNATHNNECVCESWLQVCGTGCSWNVSCWCWRTSRRSIQFSHRTQEGKDASWRLLVREGTQRRMTHDRLMIDGQHMIYISICHTHKYVTVGKSFIQKVSELGARWDGGGLFTITLFLAQTMAAETGSLGLEVVGAAVQPAKTDVDWNKPDLNDAWRQINKRKEQTGWTFSKAQHFGSIAEAPSRRETRQRGEQRQRQCVWVSSMLTQYQ